VGGEMSFDPPDESGRGPGPAAGAAPPPAASAAAFLDWDDVERRAGER